MPLMIWDAKKGELLRTLKGHKDGITAMALSGDGETIVSGSRDKTIRVWRLAEELRIAGK